MNFIHGALIYVVKSVNPFFALSMTKDLLLAENFPTLGKLTTTMSIVIEPEPHTAFLHCLNRKYQYIACPLIKRQRIFRE